jgi:4'-phosphopantetheinyl transferase
MTAVRAQSLLPLLEEQNVHVWFAVDEALSPSNPLLGTCQRLLTPAERARCSEFVFARHRYQYLLAHALLRLTLSRYAPVAPRAWSFRHNPHGRPEIDATVHGEEVARLRFNLAHTAGMSICALALDLDVGVDVEHTTRRAETIEVADAFFSPTEVRQLRALPPSLQRDRFFDYWTLKEAYIKARGLGLSLALDSFSFEVSDPMPSVPRRIDITLDDRANDSAEHWQFALFSPTSRHRAAVAIRGGAGAPVTVRAWRTIPLQGSTEFALE